MHAPPSAGAWVALHWLEPKSQYPPRQQSVESEQLPGTARQVPASAQSPFRHCPLQQAASARQTWLMLRQDPASVGAIALLHCFSASSHESPAQQSLPSEQVVPEADQHAPARAQSPPRHWLLQHSPSRTQGTLSAKQAEALAHRPERQVSPEQQSFPSAQPEFAGRQASASAHRAPRHWPLQHWESATQESPVARVLGAHWARPPPLPPGPQLPVSSQ